MTLAEIIAKLPEDTRFWVEVKYGWHGDSRPTMRTFKSIAVGKDDIENELRTTWRILYSNKWAPDFVLDATISPIPDTHVSNNWMNELELT